MYEDTQYYHVKCNVCGIEKDLYEPVLRLEQAAQEKEFDPHNYICPSCYFYKLIEKGVM